MEESQRPADLPPAGATPPTRPGAIVASLAPMSRPAVWALICGVLGIVLPIIGIAGIILGVVALRGFRDPERPRRGIGLAIAGICVGAFGIVMTAFYVIMIYGMVQSFTQIGTAIAAAEMRQIHQQAGRYAGTNGAYPSHVAEMLALQNTGLSPRSFIVDKSAPLATGLLTVGAYDLSVFDGSATARTNLAAAVRGIDSSASTYAFGDFWFARLPQPSNDPDLVFGWRVDDATGQIFVMKDDGMANFIGSEGWDGLWQADAEARERNGLPAMESPPPLPVVPAGGP